MSDLVAIEKALIQGDLSKLTEQERLSYYKHLCESLGLNPLTKPFQYMTLQGKMILYAGKDCTEQLRRIHGVSIVSLEKLDAEGLCTFTAKAKNKDGREDVSSGAVNITGLKGDALANAVMKAETKAKRRVTLSICGLGILDETELETIPNVVQNTTQATEQLPRVSCIGGNFTETRNSQNDDFPAFDELPDKTAEQNYFEPLPPKPDTSNAHGLKFEAALEIYNETECLNILLNQDGLEVSQRDFYESLKSNIKKFKSLTSKQQNALAKCWYFAMEKPFRK